MTQQALIDRLRKVEEVLDDLIALANAAMRQANNDGAEYDETEELCNGKAALSDLRELIKEAEGQGSFYGTVLLNGAFQNMTTYPALGEKP